MERLFPVQKQPPQAIAWWVAEMAYKDYVKRFGDAQTLERIAERGGFGQMELIDHLANYAQELESRLLGEISPEAEAQKEESNQANGQDEEGST